MRLFLAGMIAISLTGTALAQQSQQNPVEQRVQSQIGMLTISVISLQTELEKAQAKIAEQAKEIERLSPKTSGTEPKKN